VNRVTTLTMIGVLGLGLATFGQATPSRAAQDATPAATTLVEAVRQATAPYQDVQAALAAGYAPMLGCVSGPQGGAMGVHYMNGGLIGDGEIDASQPEALLYAPQADGRVQLAGVEYLVLADAWDAANDGPPILDGQLFNFVGSPNRYRNPAFYELHVWAGQDNPNGMFADFNPTVSCESLTAAG
jgi:hypothetical protein